MSSSLPPTLEEGEKSFQEEEDLSNYSLARDRQQRAIIPLSKYSEADSVSFVLNVMNHLNGDEPKTFDEAISYPNARHWINAMNDEMESIINKDTWILVKLPRGCKTIPCK